MSTDFFLSRGAMSSKGLFTTSADRILGGYSGRSFASVSNVCYGQRSPTAVGPRQDCPNCRASFPPPFRKWCASHQAICPHHKRPPRQSNRVSASVKKNCDEQDSLPVPAIATIPRCTNRSLPPLAPQLGGGLPRVRLRVKRCPIYRLAPLARPGRVARLRHELLDDPVKDAPIIVPLQAELNEVPARLHTIIHASGAALKPLALPLSTARSQGLRLSSSR